MLNHKHIFLGTLFVAALLHFNLAWSASDMPSSKDHPKIPRVAGTSIVGYAESNYDEGVFMTGTSENEILTENVEGKRTRIMYVGPKELSPLGILRNYQKAFDDLGEVEEVYTCKGNDCFSNLGSAFIWSESNRIPTNLGGYSSWVHYVNKNQVYWNGKVTTSESLYHVSVYSSINTGGQLKSIQDHPVINIEMVEVTDFKPTLEVVTAEDMTTKINDKGHIALYGIYFDSGSDKLKPNSDPALQEIAKALGTDSDLKLYVVGHTDNEGTVEYNQDLSQRRAASVVLALTNTHSIVKDRLTPIGVGLAAPLATNDTEEGRALNRRVELVKR